MATFMVLLQAFLRIRVEGWVCRVRMVFGSYYLGSVLGYTLV